MRFSILSWNWGSALGDDASFVTSGKRVEEGLLEIARVNGTEPAYGKRGDKFVREQRANAAFIAAVHPGVVLAMCEEIERLRNMRLNQVGEAAMSMLTEAITAVSDGKLNAVVKLGTECPYCGYESSSIEEAKAHDGTCPKHPAVIRAVRLEKEADWLAQTLANECPVCGSVRYLNYSLNGKELLWIRPTAGDWREAAHKAMEGNNGPVL